MSAPADWPPGVLAAAAVGLALAGALGSLLMAPAGRVLRATGAGGIVALQLARTGQRAQALLAAWGSEGRAAARRHVGADFLFLVGYAGLLWLVAAGTAPEIGRRTWAWVGVAGTAVGVGALAAGLLDVLENVVLLRMLRKPVPAAGDLDRQARLAWGLAVAKFGLVAVALAWLALVAFPALVTPPPG